MRTNLAMTGVGMVTSVGLTAVETFFSIRSGITRLRTQELPDSTKQWIIGGNISDWIPKVTSERLRCLAEASILQAWNMAGGGRDPSRLGPTALLIGSPEDGRPGYCFPIDSEGLKQWLNAIGIPSIVYVERIGAGSCNAQFGLIKAAELLASGAARSCIIGAVDCLLQVKVLRWLEMAYRLKCSYMEDGLIPGEGACFFVVEPLAAAEERSSHILAHVQAVSAAKEQATITSDTPNVALGLTEAVERSIKAADISPEDIGSIWSDLNGESYRAREWAFVEIRQGFPGNIELRHPVDCYGDIGCATDAGLVGLATLEQASGWSHGKHSLVFSGSEAGFRAATIVGPCKSKVNHVIIKVAEDLPQVYPFDSTLAPLGPDDEDYESSPNPPRSHFEWQLRQEHLDDLISLYYQRKTQLKDSEIPWDRVREVEQRILNHFDAAVANGPRSVWAICTGIMLKDEGAVFVATLMLGSLRGRTGIDTIRNVMSGTEKINLHGIQEGLKHAPHQDVKYLLEEWTQSQGKEDLRLVGIEVSGYRRECNEGSLTELLRQENDDVKTHGARAIRRCRYTQGLRAIENLLDQASPLSQTEFMLTALVLGSRVGINHCRNLVAESNSVNREAIRLLGLCGSRSDFRLFFQRPGVSANVVSIRSVGVLGAADTVPFLIKALLDENEFLRITAAESLELITGAGIRETAFVESTESSSVDEAARRSVQVERPTTNHMAWSNWWRQNSNRFIPEVRWRKGSPFTFEMLISTMLNKRSFYEDRCEAYLELVIRSGHDIPFEADWFVARQKKALTLWEVWWRANQTRFSPGKWYFHGQQI